MSKEELEKEYGGKICSGRDLEQIHTEVWRWLCIPKHRFTDNVLAVEPYEKTFDLRIYFFTKDHQIKIPIEYPTEKNPKGGMLGCLQNRSPLPGETHLRESNLTDGDFSRESFLQILADVTAVESQPVVLFEDMPNPIGEGALYNR